MGGAVRRMLIVGGGPGGLYLAILARQALPGAEVTVLERNRPDDTFGFGVVFSEATLDYLEDSDRRTFEALERAMVRWDHIELRLRGEVVRAGGNTFAAIARKRLLELLQARALEAGVELCFQRELTDLEAASAEHDLVVGADGVNSLVRRALAEQFGASESVGVARYIWLGTRHRYDCLTFIHQQGEHGSFGLHGYPFDDDTSTFLVETDEATWRRAGMDRLECSPLPPGESDLTSAAYLERLFAPHLGGERLLANNSRWASFRTVRNRRWHHGNVVLLGDAAHSAHFSVGSGTKMAMEDAVALAGALAANPQLPDALTAYDEERRPAVERIQRAAEPSLTWWERAGRQLDKDPRQFAFHFLTRTPRVTHDRLAVRDPRLVRAVDHWWTAAHERVSGRDALATPLRLRSLELCNRLSVLAGEPSGGPLPSDGDLAHLAGSALFGAGLVATDRLQLRLDVTGPVGDWRAERLATWQRITGWVHDHTPAKLTARVPVSGAGAGAPPAISSATGDAPASASAPGAEPPAAEALGALAMAGFDCLELVVPNGADTGTWLPAVVGAARREWPPDLPLAVSLPLPAAEPAMGAGGVVAAAGFGPAADGFVALARCATERDCDLVAVRLDQGVDPGDGSWRQLLVSERVRQELGVPTLLDGGLASTDEALTAVESGRADLCRGQPRLAAPGWTPAGTG